MAVRDALLALLTIAPAYGFQLHGELARRTGGRREVNVGQTYSTIERLGKQGLIEAAGTTADGLPLHRLTRSGRAAARAWLGGQDAAGADPADETVDRVLVSLSFPRGDAGEVLAGERERWAARLDAATRAAADAGSDAEAGLAALASAADAERARAMLAWLERVGEADAGALRIRPRADRPRRGRPAAAPASIADQASARS